MSRFYSVALICLCLLVLPAVPGRSGIAVRAEEQEKGGKPYESSVPGKDLGTQERPRPDGGKDRIYYSIQTPEEEAEKRDEEKQKLDKSLEILRNVIIDGRR